MCPACLTTAALTAAGGTTMGAVFALFVRRLFKRNRSRPQAVPTPKEPGR